MDENYDKSIFDTLLKNGEEWVYYLHGHQIVIGTVTTNNKYDIALKTEDRDRLPVTKHNIKFVYPVEHHDELKKRIKIDKKVKKEEQGPILNPRKRNHIKNKTLFPLMKERKVLDITILEGEVLSGVVAGFTRYEITLLSKGRLPIILLRHAIYDVRDKSNKSFLKRTVEEKKVIVRKRRTIVSNR